MDWKPHFDFHDESRWPPREHPLYSMFHDARLGMSPWNYQKALEYAELVRRQRTYLKGEHADI